MKKNKNPKPRAIWEPENHPHKLDLPKPTKIFGNLPVLRANMLARKFNPGKQLHCECGPAVVFEGGDLEWWRHGELHRDGDEPAIEIMDGRSETIWAYPRPDSQIVELFTLPAGTKVWASNGFVHRDGAPAFQMQLESDAAYEEYWFNGRRHNEFGPAVRTHATQIYFYHGLAHRADGPAVLSDENELNQRGWYWYGKALVDRNELVPNFPFKDPPPDYLLKALLDAKFSENLTASLPLMLPRVVGLMPDFEKLMSVCCDAVSWQLVQAHIRAALNPGEIEDSYALPPGVGDHS